MSERERAEGRFSVRIPKTRFIRSSVSFCPSAEGVGVGGYTAYVVLLIVQVRALFARLQCLLHDTVQMAS